MTQKEIEQYRARAYLSAEGEWLPKILGGLDSDAIIFKTTKRNKKNNQQTFESCRVVLSVTSMQCACATFQSNAGGAPPLTAGAVNPVTQRNRETGERDTHSESMKSSI